MTTQLTRTTGASKPAPSTQRTPAPLFGADDVIYSYTRAQAIADGEQVLLTGELAQLAREVGYKYPVYVTTGVWTLVEMAVASKRHGNDLKGVLWDILWMSRRASQAVTRSKSRFQVIITGTGRRRYHTMLIECGPTDSDDPAPALTIMLPAED